MLKRVVFLLKKENGIALLESLRKELAKRAVEAVMIPVFDGRNDAESSSECGAGYDAWNVSKCGVRYVAEEAGAAGRDAALYVTDDEGCFSRLFAAGLPVIVYLHEGNREADFRQAAYAIENLSEIEYQSLELAYRRLSGLPWDILETERCRVRETTVEDVDSFYEIYREPSITYYMEGLFEDIEEERAYIRDYIRNVYGFYGYGMWTVLEKTGGEVIGRAGIVWREGCDIPELGFVIALPWQRQGYAYEVCRAILAYGHKELGFDSVQALIMAGNTASRELCRKLGFVYLEDVEVDKIKYQRMIYNNES